jgi:glyoxylase-like metal-dependent hydrolase (beta-lactamase superfamily II)
MAQLQLVALSDGIQYLPGAVNVGVVETGDGGCVLIDSGADKDHGKRILKACRAAGLEPKAIVNTHSHADHFGGNAHLIEALGIPAYAPIFEEAVMRYPVLEPIYLWGGARPPQELHNKWLLAPASPTKVLNEPGVKTIAGVELELLEVSGHAHIQFAVRVRDVLFAADAVFGRAILEKYPLQFMVDVQHVRESIEVVRLSASRVTLPGHGEPVTDVDALCDANLAAVERAASATLAACHGGATLGEAVERVCAMLEVTISDTTRFVLNQTAVLAHLTDLEERGQIKREVTRNRLVWTALQTG